MMKIRLLLVDDFEADRYIEKLFIEQAFYDVEVITLARPPEPLSEVFKYDGLVIDERLLAGVSGSEVAKEVHYLDWRLPIMLISGSPGVDSLMALRYIDQVARKGDQVEIAMKATAFIRGIARLRK